MTQPLDTKDAEINRKLDLILQRQVQADQERTEIRRVVNRLDEAIRGNGKPGLSTQVAVLEGRIHELEKDVNDCHQRAVAERAKKNKELEENLPKEGGDPVSTINQVKAWLADKFWIPLTIAIVIWILTDLIPKIQHAIATLEQLP